MGRDFSGAAGNFLATTGSPPNLELGTVNGPYSFGAWVRADATNGERTVMSKYQSRGPTLRVFDGKLRMFTINSGDSGQEAIGATTIPTGVWVHVGGNFDGTTAIRVMVNGVQDATAPMTGQMVASQSPNWHIGRRADGVAIFDGRICEAFLSMAHLSNAEWLALARGVSPILVRPAALAGYWPIWGVGAPEVNLVSPLGPMIVNGSLPVVDHAPSGPPVAVAA